LTLCQIFFTFDITSRQFLTVASRLRAPTDSFSKQDASSALEAPLYAISESNADAFRQHSPLVVASDVTATAHNDMINASTAARCPAGLDPPSCHVTELR